jgi:hypothetical protein
VFYPLVRSGWTQRFADPALMSVQILWGCLIAVVAYATVPTGRAALLQTMGLGLVFGFMSLSHASGRAHRRDPHRHAPGHACCRFRDVPCPSSTGRRKPSSWWRPPSSWA